MQYTDDLLHVYVLAKTPDLRNPDEFDAGLPIKTPSAFDTRLHTDSFDCAGLGKIELRQSIHSFWAMIALKIDGELAAGAELVWEDFVAHRSWTAVRQFFEIATSSRIPNRPPFFENPSLAVGFMPGLDRPLTPAQQNIAVSILWGRAIQIRQQALVSASRN